MSADLAATGPSQPPSPSLSLSLSLARYPSPSLEPSPTLAPSADPSSVMRLLQDHLPLTLLLDLAFGVRSAEVYCAEPADVSLVPRRSF